jgi:hypothetical protein
MPHQKGTVVRPFTGDFFTELVKTKPGENQLPGDVLVYDRVNKYYELPAVNDANEDCVIVTDAQTNFGTPADTNLSIDGEREVLRRKGEICVTAGGAITPGSLVKYSATTPGTVDAWVYGTDTDRTKIVGRFVKLASEYYHDVEDSLTSAVAGNLIIIEKADPIR